MAIGVSNYASSDEGAQPRVSALREKLAAAKENAAGRLDNFCAKQQVQEAMPDLRELLSKIKHDNSHGSGDVAPPPISGGIKKPRILTA